MSSKFHFISWGGGLQSTTMAVMSALGDLPKVDAVVFSDPGFESQETYNSLEFYIDWLSSHGILAEVVKPESNIRNDYLSDHINMPFWTESGAPLRRQCTQHYKLIPLKRRFREIAGYDRVKYPHPKPGEFEVWIGFTLDEQERMSTSRYKYMVYRWPLIKLGMIRDDCVSYLQNHGLPIPSKSACVICPYRNAADWITICDGSSDDWEDAVRFDSKIRNSRPLENSKHDKIYLYHGLVPLDLADLDSDALNYKLRQKDKAHQLIICDGGSCWT